MNLSLHKLIACIAIITLFSFVANSQKDSIYSSIDSIHSPKKATMMSVAIPGMGQIYNDIKKPEGFKSRLWWKLPLIYGGIGTSIYFVIQNQKYYTVYRNERLDLQNDINNLYSISGYSDAQLKSITDQYSRWRDLSIVAALGVYLINIVDANVSGNLLHFDNSNDLSIIVQPKVFYSNQLPIAGASLSFHFKNKEIRNDYVPNNF
ncbi:DUF5683 domain-containing protein [Flavobacteriales bacterium]|nr:DUF5683 domain-containing protein [Flavobacteriales bacterium]